VVGVDPAVERVEVAGVDQAVVEALAGERCLRVGVDREGAGFERHRSSLSRHDELGAAEGRCAELHRVQSA
jgi:hypothetical protein